MGCSQVGRHSYFDNRCAVRRHHTYPAYLAEEHSVAQDKEYSFWYDNNTIGSYKSLWDQINTSEFKQRYTKLISGLDKDSLDCVGKILSRLRLVASQSPIPRGGVEYLDIFSLDEKYQLDKMRREFIEQILRLSDDCWAYNQYLLPINSFEPSVFYYQLQIDTLKNPNYFMNKDIIDVGGYIGDSALVLCDYTTKNVYAFEPTTIYHELMQKTIELNSKKNIVPVKQALGSKNERLTIKIAGLVSRIVKEPELNVSDGDYESIEVTTLDDFVKGRDIDIGLIKVDIEGFEQEFLKGAISTIKQYKPTLLLSIYHNADDFFGIKPLIESWDLGYTFRISRPVLGAVKHDTLLICEQKS